LNSPIFAFGLYRELNDRQDAMAAFRRRRFASCSNIVGNIDRLLLAAGILILVVAGRGHRSLDLQFDERTAAEMRSCARWCEAGATIFYCLVGGRDHLFGWFNGRAIGDIWLSPQLTGSCTKRQGLSSAFTWQSWSGIFL